MRTLRSSLGVFAVNISCWFFEDKHGFNLIDWKRIHQSPAKDRTAKKQSFRKGRRDKSLSYANFAFFPWRLCV
jgi:hypothetical protein